MIYVSDRDGGRAEACPVCGASGGQPIYPETRDAMLACAPQSINAASAVAS